MQNLPIYEEKIVLSFNIVSIRHVLNEVLCTTLAWIRVSADDTDEAVYLVERCEIPACDMSGGVCGAAQPMVKDITGGSHTGTIEYHWDGVMSQFESMGTCEQRVMAPNGAYTATFCWSLAVELFDPASDPASEGGVGGTVSNPICRDVSFRIPDDREVVHGLFGG